MEVVATSADAGQIPHSGVYGDLVPLDQFRERLPPRLAARLVQEL